MFKKSSFTWISAAALLAGCTVDNVVLLRHPDSVVRGETFTVGALGVVANGVVVGDSGEAIRRDSLRFGVGLPAGWEVVSAKVCAAPHFRFLKASVNGLDTNRRNQLLLDTLAACEGRAVPLAADPGVKAFLAGRTYRAGASPENLGKSFNVKADTVPQWFGFAGRIDFDVPADAPADTVFDPATSPDVVAESTAVKALPLYVYITLKAPQRDTSVRLLYFSKTGRLDSTVKTSDVDKGVLVYRPLQVVSPVSLGRTYRAEGASLALAGGPSGHLLLLPAAPGGSAWARLEIRGPDGSLLRAWPASALAGSVPWDGTDAAGRRLPPGRYLAVLEGPGLRRVLAFPLIP